jgi:hypothetical protein
MTKLGDTTGDGSRVREALEGVVPLEFKITYYPIFDSSDPYLHCWEITSGDPNTRFKLQMARKYGRVNDTVSIANNVICLALSFGIDAFKNNPIIRMFKYYVDAVEGPIGRTAFNGDPIVNENDIMSLKRCTVLLNAAFTYHEAIMNDASFDKLECIVEVAQFIFQDPDYNTKQFKSMTNLLTKSVFSLTTRGKYLEHNGDMKLGLFYGSSEREISEQKLPNDRVYYNTVAKDIASDLTKLKEVGLLRTRVCYNGLITADFTRENIAIFVYLQAAIGWSGYTRTDHHLSFIDQMSAPDQPPKTEENYTMIPHLKNEYRAFIDYTQAPEHKDRLMGYNDLVSSVNRILTGKSGGGPKIDVRTRVSERIASRIRTVVNGFIKLRLGDKRTEFYHDPWAYLDFTNLVSEVKGVIGNRYVVGGKQVRAIFVQRLVTIVFEYIFAASLQRYVVIPYEESRTIDSNHDFSVGKEVGALFLDHMVTMIATSRPEYITELADFTQFDSSQGMYNVRQPMIDAVTSALIDHNLVGDFGKIKGGLVTIIKAIWNKTGSTWKLPKSDMFDSTQEEAIYEALGSGELLTTLINCLTNRANFKAFMELMQRIFVRDGETRVRLDQVFVLQLIRILGDDYLGVWKLFNDGQYLYNEITHKAFVQARVAETKRNGMDMNVLKTTFRIFYGEYLKKTFIYGKYVPLQHTQKFSKERDPKLEHPVEEYSAYCSTLRVLGYRGTGPDLLERLAFWRWNLKRSIKKRRGNITTWIALPPALFYTPISLRGVGNIPWMLHGASKDNLIAVYCAMMPIYRILVEVAASSMNFPTDRLTRDIAKQIANDIDTTPAEYFKPGIEFIRHNMPESRVKSAMNAQARLEKSLISVDESLKYQNLPENLIIDTIVSNKSMVAVAEVIRYDTITKSELRMKKGLTTVSLKDHFPIVFATVWARGSIVPPRTLQTPFGYIDPGLENVVKHVGVATLLHKNRIRPSEILELLKKGDPIFPGNLSEDGVLAAIAHPKVFQDDQKIIDVFLSLGAKSENAAKVAARIRGAWDGLTLRKSANAYSLGGTFFSTLDFSMKNLERVIDIPSYFPRPMHIIYLELGIMLFTAELLRTGEATMWTVHHSLESEVEIQKTFNKTRVHENFVKLNKMFQPRAERIN